MHAQWLLIGVAMLCAAQSCGRYVPTPSYELPITRQQTNDSTPLQSVEDGADGGAGVVIVEQKDLNGSQGEASSSPSATPLPSPTPIPKPPRQALTFSSSEAEDDEAVVEIKNVEDQSEAAWQMLIWPDEDEVITIEGICNANAPTKINLRIKHPESGPVTPPSSHLGALAVLANGIQLGFETGTCRGDLCQDDHIADLTCPSGAMTIEGL